MKKNLSKLVLEVGSSSARQQRGAFKINCQNVHKYTNKIIVDAVEYNKPTNAELYINQQMQEYQAEPSEEENRIYTFSERMRKKSEKHVSISYLLSQLEINPQILAMEQVMCAIRFARKEQLAQVRPKLVKVENSLSFKLEEGELQPHEIEALQSFLSQLNEVINKSNKVC